MEKKEHIALRIVERLQESGYDAFWVGGCVRNMLMGLPSDDIDIATSAPAEVVMNLFPRTIPVGVQFGVVIILENDVQTEVATFRSDGEYLDYRHPVEVHFSSAKEDANRRDFTINSLFYDPIEKELYDFVEGRKGP